VHFAAFENHIGFYPGPEAIHVFGEELSQYDTSKGTIKFPIHQPIPFDLVQRIVEFRVQQSQKK